MGSIWELACVQETPHRNFWTLATPGLLWREHYSTAMKDTVSSALRLLQQGYWTCLLLPSGCGKQLAYKSSLKFKVRPSLAPLFGIDLPNIESFSFLPAALCHLDRRSVGEAVGNGPETKTLPPKVS